MNQKFANKIHMSNACQLLLKHINLLNHKEKNRGFNNIVMAPFHLYPA